MTVFVGRISETLLQLLVAQHIVVAELTHDWEQPREIVFTPDIWEVSLFVIINIF